MRVVNPYTEESQDIEETSDVVALFEQIEHRSATWRALSVKDRANTIRMACQKLIDQRHYFESLISEEVGKPITLSRLELDRTIEEWLYMADNAERFLESEVSRNVEVHYAPLGIVAVISPWNFPILLPLRGIIPALLAGNGVIFKPSELSPRTGIAIAQLFTPEIPIGLAIGGKELGARIVSLPVSAIAFTGSTAVGKWIAGQASLSLKRVILELGGLDAAIVRQDANVARAAQEIVLANARNSGQVCNAVKRALVHRSVYKDFIEQAIQASQALVYGDPLDPATELGPLVSAAQRERVRSFLDDAVSKGAKAQSVSLPIERGFFFSHTILTDVPHDALLLREEPFGPLLPILPFSDDREAIKIANNTPFGLTASVWTADERAMRSIAEQLTVGMVRLNSHNSLGAGVPWGGCKESGLGRMKTKEGLREFTNVRVIAT